VNIVRSKRSGKEMTEVSNVTNSTKTSSLVISHENTGFRTNKKGFYGQIAYRSNSKHIIITQKGTLNKIQLNFGFKVASPQERKVVHAKKIKAYENVTEDYSDDLTPLSHRVTLKPTTKAFHIKLNKCSTKKRTSDNSLYQRVFINEQRVIPSLRNKRREGNVEENQLTFYKKKE